MKFKIMGLVLVLISIFLFFLFNIKYIYKEDVLYSQNDIRGYSEEKNENNNLIGRNEAIKIAKHYIEDVLGNNLNSSDYKMNVNLYRNDENTESYYWNISWEKYDLSCSIQINTINGEIEDIYFNKYAEYDQFSSSKLTREEVLDIAGNLIDELGFDLDLYDLSVVNIIDYTYYGNSKTNYDICTFTNKNNINDKFLITIDSKGKFITRYRRNPYVEVY
ncbi:hypothetical protein [Intestinibacter sp.]